MKQVIELKDGEVLRGRFTTEELNEGYHYIATSWCPDDCLEQNRIVESYETFSKAKSRMFEMALEYSLQYSNLKLIEVNK